MQRAHFAAVAIAGLVLSVCTPSLPAADYYVSNGGSDDHPGDTPSQPWKTVSQVNRFSFSPGDAIHFEKGGTWREQLVPHSGSQDGCVTYTSYGTGAKPLLLGSVEKNHPDDWSREGDSLWSAGPFAQDVGNIIFNSGDLCGVKVWDETALDRQNTFWYDRASKVVKIYCDRNPATLYDDIECALTRHIISQGGRSYVIYDGLHLAYGAAHGIGGGGTHHIIVRNCDLCFIGGGHQFTRQTPRGPRHVRYGNGVEFWSSAHDNLVENCRIWDIYDAGLTNQGSGANQQYNIVYRNNKIWNCEYSFEYWNRPAESSTRDICFENNSCFHAGRGWSHAQRPWPAGVHLMFFSNQAQTDRFFVRNNVFHRAENSFIHIDTRNWNGIENLSLEGNLHCQPADRPLVRWGDKAYGPLDFEAYQRETGKSEGSSLVALSHVIPSPDRVELAAGASQQIKVSAVYSQGTTVDVTDLASYASSDDTVASVDAAGNVEGLRPGSAAVRVTFEAATATAAVSVKR